MTLGWAQRLLTTNIMHNICVELSESHPRFIFYKKESKSLKQNIYNNGILDEKVTILFYSLGRIIGVSSKYYMKVMKKPILSLYLVK